MTALRPCYLFDIDGTLADCSHRLHHIQGAAKDWRAFFAACLLDLPIGHMIDLAIKLYDADQAVVLVSGRSNECRDQTEEWLDRHHVPQCPLYMRRAGDRRPDDIVKSEFLDLILADGFQPIMAFDDRSRVVRMWRDRGIPCAQVADGDF